MTNHVHLTIAGHEQPGRTLRRNLRFTVMGCAISLLVQMAAGGVALPPPQQVLLGSGPLIRSVQNEVDAAIARAQSWLVAQQASDGSWGEGRHYLAAICALALHGDTAPGPPAHAAAQKRALRWLNEHPTTADATGSNMLDTAWVAIALQILEPDTAKRTPLPSLSTTNSTEVLVVLALREACALRPATNAMPSLPSNTNVVVQLIQSAQEPYLSPNLQEWVCAVAHTWAAPDLLAWRETRAQRAWWLARTINRQAHGSLMLTPAQPLNWRRDLADYWVNRQRIDPQAGGFWLVDDHPSVEETAFAILLLREL